MNTGNDLPITKQKNMHLLTLRKEAHLTQQEVADRIGCTVKTYRSYEASGTIDPANLVALADVFSVSTDFILCRSDYRTPEDADLCRLTGLSEKAIRQLKQLDTSHLGGSDLRPVLSCVLETGETDRLLSPLKDYLSINPTGRAKLAEYQGEVLPVEMIHNRIFARIQEAVQWIDANKKGRL